MIINGKLCKHKGEAAAPSRRRLLELVAVGSALAISLIPKCPLCLAGYLSLFAVSGVHACAVAGYVNSKTSSILAILLLAITLAFHRIKQLRKHLVGWICVSLVAIFLFRNLIITSSVFRYVTLIALLLADIWIIFLTGAGKSRTNDFDPT